MSTSVNVLAKYNTTLYSMVSSRALNSWVILVATKMAVKDRRRCNKVRLNNTIASNRKSRTRSIYIYL